VEQLRRIRLKLMKTYDCLSRELKHPKQLTDFKVQPTFVLMPDDHGGGLLVGTETGEVVRTD